VNHDHPDHVQVLVPGIDLELDSAESVSSWNSVGKGGMGVLGFEVESRGDVDRLHADLVTEGDSTQQEPYDAPWGARPAVEVRSMNQPRPVAVVRYRPAGYGRESDPWATKINDS